MTNLFSRASRSITITARQPFTFDINSESPFVTVTGFTLGKRRDWVPRVQVLITISHMDIIRVIRAMKKAMLSNQSWIWNPLPQGITRRGRGSEPSVQVRLQLPAITYSLNTLNSYCNTSHNFEFADGLPQLPNVPRPGLGDHDERPGVYTFMVTQSENKCVVPS